MALYEIHFTPTWTYKWALGIIASLITLEIFEEKVKEWLVFQAGGIVLGVGLVKEEHTLVVNKVEPLTLVGSKSYLCGHNILY